jgi:sulfur-oxidizing protein SoxY
MKKLAFLFVLLCSAFSVAQAGNSLPVDPFNSPQWGVMQKHFLADDGIVFDDKVKVFGPEFAEDSLNVPISFDASELKNIKEIIVFADLNPIPLVLRYEPGELSPYLAFRIKLEQSSPVRVAVKTTDNTWHVGGVWVDAAGGGCVAPSHGTTSGDWTSSLGKVSAKIWKRSDAPNRMRFRIMHPMDTGLAAGIPRFHIENMTLRNKEGKELAKIELFEPISENPMLSLAVDDYEQLNVDGRDNNGNLFKAVMKQ